MSMCELTIVQGHDQNLGQMLIIHDDQRRTIGRSSACDFKVDDEMMSGMHCQVLLNKNWLIRDLLSRNGLLVNETAVHEKQLKPGDRIQIGQTMFEFQLAGATGSGQPVPAAPETPVIQLDDDDSDPIDPLRQTRILKGPIPQLPNGTKPLGRQIEKRGDLELSKLAIKNDLLSHPQLQECIDIQQEMSDVKIQMTLEEIFQEREYLSKDQIKHLVREYKYTRRRTKDLFYAEVAAGNQLVDRVRLDECLSEQEKAFCNGDKIPYLGELLVQKKYISIKDNNKVIRGIKQYKEGDDERRTRDGL